MSLNLLHRSVRQYVTYTKEVYKETKTESTMEIKAANVLLFTDNDTPAGKGTKENPFDINDLEFFEDNLLFKLCDFSSEGHYPNISSGQSSMSKTLLQPTFAQTTLVFSAPEVLQGNNYSLKSDIFSLGMLFYELFRPDLKYPWAVEFKIYNKQAQYQIEKKVLNNERPCTNIKGLDGNEPKKEREREEFMRSQMKGEKPTNHMKKQYREIMEDCWNENPEFRPSICQVLEVVNCLMVPYLQETILEKIKDLKGNV